MYHSNLEESGWHDAITHCVFQQNAAGNDGGAYQAVNLHSLEFSNSTFLDNTAAVDGGALYVSEVGKKGTVEPVLLECMQAIVRVVAIVDCRHAVQTN